MILYGYITLFVHEGVNKLSTVVPPVYNPLFKDHLHYKPTLVSILALV